MIAHLGRREQGGPADEHRSLLYAWLVPAAALLVALVTAGGVFLLHQYAQDAQSAQLRLVEIDERAEEHHATIWQGIAKGQIDAAIIEDLHDLERDLHAVREGLDGDLATRVHATFQAYAARFAEVVSLIESGQTAWARAIMEADGAGGLSALFDAFSQTLHAGRAEHGARAARASLEADIGATLALLLAAGTISLLSWQSERTRSRHAAALASASALRQGETRFQALVQHGADLLTVVAPEGAVRYQSPSSSRVLGHAAEALVGRPFAELTHPDDADTARWLVAEAGRRAGTAVAGELRFRHADGAWRTIEALASLLPAEAGLDGVLVTSRDVTERKALEEQLRHQAFHDPLTGLPNRALFRDRLEHGLARAARTAAPLTVLFLDLDGFKVVNDSLGHDAGDELLVTVARRLRDCIRPGDTIARIGGDEFTILLEDADIGAAIEVVERIAGRLRAPIDLDGHPVVVGTTIGVASKGSPEDRAEDLLRNADVAMYAAKQNGKGRHAVYDASMRAKAWERMELEAELRRAITDGEFRVHYQPIVDLATGRLAEVEALVRWAHPKRGLIAPGEFLPLAEETGLILPIGWWVLGEACRQVRAWQLAVPSAQSLAVGVNLSPRMFHHPRLAEEVARILAETGLDPACLKLEITEGVMMQDAADAVETLRRLKELGVQLAMDDFGTGYSSLAYLQHFPLDVLKIDRSFVSRLGIEGDGFAFVRTIIGLAKTLDLAVVGEGVETDEQREHLQALGSDQGQGYLFARPLPAAEMFGLLAEGAGWQETIADGLPVPMLLAPHGPLLANPGAIPAATAD
ncbi:MAG: hypothetical protein QOF01_2017 [Thermomicrobiales bacterium]|nr:hypothetical protein [Thermomicrobiales bacterium]